MNNSVSSSLIFNESIYSVTASIRYGNSTAELRGFVVSLLIPAVMFVCGIFGNVLALIVLVRSSKRHKKYIFYTLVGGLAITDLFGTLVTSPVVLLVYENRMAWVGGQPLCDYFSFMMIFGGFATVFFVGALALERYVSILHPFFYDAHVSPKKTPFILLGMWIMALVIASLPLIGIGQNVIHYPGTWCFFNFYGTTITDKAFTYLYAGNGLLALLATTILNGVVIVVLFRMRKNMLRISIASGKMKRRRNRHDLQMTLFLIGIVIIQGICWAPLLIRVIINQSGYIVPNVQSDLIVIRLASFNHILNPWVYILLRTKSIIRILYFPKMIAKLFRHDRADTRNTNGEMGQNPINRLLQQNGEKTPVLTTTYLHHDSQCLHKCPGHYIVDISIL